MPSGNGATIIGGYTAGTAVMKANMPHVSTPQVGDIMYTPRSGGGHVSLVVSVSGNTVEVISGNSSDMVRRSTTTINNPSATWLRPNYGGNDPGRVIDIAVSQLGTVEGKGNMTKYGAWIGMNGKAWCASFLSWCYHQAYDDDADFVPVGPMSEAGSWDEYGNYSGSTSGLGVGADGLTFHGHIWGNSALATYYSRLSNDNYYPRDNRASHVVVHSAFKSGTIEELALMVNESDKAYNYGVDSQGQIGLFVDEQLWTASCDSPKDDQFAINIICMNAGDKLSEATVTALTDLMEDIYRRNFIYLVTFNDNIDDTLTLHRQYNPASGCPGAAVEKQLRKIADEVNNRLSAKIANNFVQVGSRLAQSRLDALRTESLINVAELRPYVIIVDVTKVTNSQMDYTTLRICGVVGVYFYVGSGLDHGSGNVEYHNKAAYALCEGAKMDIMPFGYIFTSKAETPEEVKKEAYWMFFIISKYPPKLGVWVECDFNGSSSKTCRELTDVWYDKFVDWGLKSKCGLYCSMEQAKKINWPDQANYMPLWLSNEMVDNVCPDDELLTPTFFKLDDLSNYGISSTLRAMIFAELGTSTWLSQGGERAPGGGSYDGSLIVEGGDGYTNYIIPQVTDHAVAKKWESYTAITNQRTMNYKLTHSAQTITDSMGFRKYDGRYLIAVGSGICSQPGTYMDVKLANGTVIPCIMGDGKADIHTDSNNIYTNVNSTWCCSEFIVDKNVVKEKWNGAGDCSRVMTGWDSPVVEIKVYNKRVVNV